jgi:hypothetical protein
MQTVIGTDDGVELAAAPDEVAAAIFRISSTA